MADNQHGSAPEPPIITREILAEIYRRLHDDARISRNQLKWLRCKLRGLILPPADSVAPGGDGLAGGVPPLASPPEDGIDPSNSQGDS